MLEKVHKREYRSCVCMCVCQIGNLNNRKQKIKPQRSDRDKQEESKPQVWPLDFVSQKLIQETKKRNRRHQLGIHFTCAATLTTSCSIMV